MQVRAPVSEQVSQTCVTNATNLPPVLPRERRKEVMRQHAELLKRRRLDKAVTGTARRKLEDGIPAFLDNLEVTSIQPPIAIGPGHTLGYAGCLRCGGVAGYMETTKLVNECLNGCPSGSRAPINRLMQGLVPRPLPGGGGREWRSGEAQPRVLRLVPPVPASPESMPEA